MLIIYFTYSQARCKGLFKSLTVFSYKNSSILFNDNNFPLLKSSVLDIA